MPSSGNTSKTTLPSSLFAIAAMCPYYSIMGFLLTMFQMSMATKSPFTVPSPSSVADSNLKFPWCRTASIDELGKVVSESIIDLKQLGDQTFDQSQSAQWMEYIERNEGRLGDEGGAGAYDTMRCDIVFPFTSSSDDDVHENVVVWGEDFHLNRLKRSYSALNKQQATDQELDEAIQHSKKIISHLLSQAKSDAKTIQKQMESSGETSIVLVRVTILWSPPKLLTSGAHTPVGIRGHACSTFKFQNPTKLPPPISASLAAQLQEDEGGRRQIVVDEAMPSRHADPQNKIASWCRERKQLQVNSLKQEIEEVLMVRNREDDQGTNRLEILEGLSSNFFVILKDGTVRTATEGCLHGYVRHLVLSLLDQCGLKFDPTPVFVDESSEWEEAFITSSSRLIYPIEQIIIVPSSGNEDEVKEFWRYHQTLNGKEQEMKCVTLRKLMLRSSGYKL